eukprot:TRINITY_DN5052_c0_g1_i1.p1 TRINITY_DN5052_c0_g1~~TRINITY_DN5052_c0_g1_i1.p1  ORF type:complete len:2354 (+),score=659.43 TRINITY_DN5052_c0_g1_i1:270-7331(+)
MEAQAMTVAPDQLRLFQRVMNNKLQALSKNPSPSARYACIKAVDALITVEYSDSSSRTAHLSFFSNFLSNLLCSQDHQQVQLAAAAMGRILKTDFVLTHDIVDAESNRYLEWLTNKQVDKYYCATIGFRELAAAAPTFMSPRVKCFRKALWIGLSHPSIINREAVSSAFAILLKIETPTEDEEDDLLVKCIASMSTDDPTLCHGAMLVVVVIINEVGLPKNGSFEALCSNCISICEQSNLTYLRLAAVKLICALATYAPQSFSSFSKSAAMVCACLAETKSTKEYEEPPVSHLLAPCGIPSKVKQTAFQSLACIIETECDCSLLGNALGGILKALNDDPPCLGAAACVVAANKACGNNEVVAKLSETLVSRAACLPLCPLFASLLIDFGQQSAQVSEQIMEIIIDRLEDVLSAHQIDTTGEALCVALDTLAVCNVEMLGNCEKLVMHVLPLLQHSRSDIRMKAAAANASLVTVLETPSLCQDILVETLRVAVSDPCPDVRLATLRSIQSKSLKCELMKQDVCVEHLCASLVDEVADAREVALEIIATVASDAQFVVDRLRLLAKQVTTELQCPTDAMQQEQAARMLGHLARLAPHVVYDKSVNLNDLLLERLLSANSARFKASLLRTLYLQLDSCHKFSTATLNILMDTCSDILTGQSSVASPPAAKLLGYLLSRGHIVNFSSQHPYVLPRLFEFLREGDPETRSEALQLLGIIGAIDLGKATRKKPLSECSIKATSSDFDAHITSATLLEILELPSLAFHRRATVQALQSVLKAVPSIAGAKPSALLARVMPALINLLESCRSSQHCDPALAETLFRALVHTVAMATPPPNMHQNEAVVNENRAVALRYVDQMVSTMKDFWDPQEQQQTLTIILLAEELHLVLNAMKEHVHWLMPKLIELVRAGLYDSVLATRAVHAFEVMSQLVIPFLIPVCVCLLDVASATDQLPELRIKCVQTLGTLSCWVPMKEVSARVIHALVRISVGVVTPAADARHGVGAEAIHTLVIVANSIGSDFEMFRRSVTHSLREMPGAEAQNALQLLSLQSENGLPRPRSLSGSSSKTMQRHVTEYDRGTHQPMQHHVNTALIESTISAYPSSQHSELDCERWLDAIAQELLAQSPRTVLRACAHVGRGHPPLARTLFPQAFALCYNSVNSHCQEVMSAAIREMLLMPGSRKISNPLLNLCVFVERAYDQHFADIGERQHKVYKFLPPDKLWPLAEICQNYPLALYWLETEVYRIERDTAPADPTAWPESARVAYLDACRKVVHMNKCLEQPYQAEGMLALIKRKGVADSITGAETYEDLGWWHRACEQYTRASEEEDWPHHVAGMMRCKEHMGDWRGVLSLSTEWVSPAVKKRTARAVSHAAWMLSDWGSFKTHVDLMPKPGEGTARRPGDSPAGCTAALYRSILAVKNKDYESAEILINQCREGLEKDVREHVGGGKGRGYELMVMLQHLAEVSEIIEYSTKSESRREELMKVWSTRLRNMRHDAWHMRDTLVLRSLVVEPHEMIDDWLHYVGILETKRAARTLKTLLGGDTSNGNEKMDSICNLGVNPKLVIVYLQHIWEIETKGRANLLTQLEEFVASLDPSTPPSVLQDALLMMAQWKQTIHPNSYWMEPHRDLLLRQLLSAKDIVQQQGTTSAKYRIWHEWALLNLRIAHRDDTHTLAESGAYALEAIKGFVRCIELCDPPELATQDVLRLLRLMFSFGCLPEVEQEFRRTFKTMVTSHWVPVLPQIVARLGGTDAVLVRTFHDLLCMIAQQYPQKVLLAVSVPLRSVAAETSSKMRKLAANAVYEQVSKRVPQLASEAECVTTGLVRVAVLWSEKWYECLMEANRLWMLGDGAGVVAIMAPLHEELAKPATELDRQFKALYERELGTAKVSWLSWKETHHQTDMKRSWIYYGQVYARLQEQLKAQRVIHLKDASHELYSARDLLITIPGIASDDVAIKQFCPMLHVIGSKRRPKQLTVIGDDGNEYLFLLKGQEDLRLDQRVMQLLSLVNTLIKVNETSTQTAIPLIETYAVVPLSPTAGLIGWVERAQTMDRIVSEMRGNKPHKMKEELDTLQQHGFANTLTVIQKMEALEMVLSKSQSDDIHMFLWLRSADPGEWIERRTIFTRSNAMMSMVGYIIGLGDRHPGNLMYGHDGKVVHIDFADCFESAMIRDVFPEKVPFRLTSMMVRAMGVGGVSGTFKRTACAGMSILRKGKHPLMAMLEAFVHDPIVSWRLDMREDGNERERHVEEGDLMRIAASRPSPSSYVRMGGEQRDETNTTNVTAVIKRIQSKLDGTDCQKIPTPVSNPPSSPLSMSVINPHDFATPPSQQHTLDVTEQVITLVHDAQSLEHLAQCYIGWCPFW